MNSIALATFSTIVALAIGVPVAVLIAKTKMPFRRLITVCFSVPILIPPYVLATGWFEILGRDGLVSRFTSPSVGEMTSSWLFSLPGAVLVLSTAFLPVILLLSLASLRGVNPTLEDAARLFCGWPLVLKRITIPLALPGIWLSLVLVFLLAMGEFGAPSYLRLSVFPVESFTQFSAFYNAGAATAASIPMLLVVAIGLLAGSRLLREGTHYFRWAGSQVTPHHISLGRFAPLTSALVLIAALVLIVAPCAALIWRGFSGTAMNSALLQATDSIAWSLLYAGIAASGVALLGFFLAYASQRRSFAKWLWIDGLTLFLFAIPGTVIGIAAIVTWNHPLTGWLYASPAILILGFAAQYIAIGTHGIAAGLAQFSPSLEEAAEIAGAGWFRRVATILTPLSKTAITAAWLLTFIFCLRDSSLSLLLSPPGRETLTARTMTLMANGSPDVIAALCLISMLLPVIPLAIFGIAVRIVRKRA
ncbi:MAG: iron ABC transporter permease [Bryobacteraceae bacterium]